MSLGPHNTSPMGSGFTVFSYHSRAFETLEQSLYFLSKTWHHPTEKIVSSIPWQTINKMITFNITLDIFSLQSS